MLKKGRMIIGVSAAVVLGGGVVVWQTVGAASTTTVNSSVQVVIEHQIKRGLVQSEQVIPSSTVAVDRVPTRSDVARLLSAESQRLDQIFEPTSSDVTSYLTAYQTALANLAKGRNESVTFNSFTLNSLTLSSHGNSAMATYTTEVTTHDVFAAKGAWKGADLHNGYYGSATLQRVDGTWLLANLSWNYLPGQGP